MHKMTPNPLSTAVQGGLNNILSSFIFITRGFWIVDTWDFTLPFVQVYLCFFLALVCSQAERSRLPTLQQLEECEWSREDWELSEAGLCRACQHVMGGQFQTGSQVACLRLSLLWNRWLFQRGWDGPGVVLRAGTGGGTQHVCDQPQWRGSLRADMSLGFHQSPCWWEAAWRISRPRPGLWAGGYLKVNWCCEKHRALGLCTSHWIILQIVIFYSFNSIVQSNEVVVCLGFQYRGYSRVRITPSKVYSFLYFFTSLPFVLIIYLQYLQTI